MTGVAPRAAVLGYPVAHSLSPRLHGYWLKHYGIAGSYEALAVAPDDLIVTLRGLQERGFTGVNLTVPHKEAALAAMDRLDPVAAAAGAVNTVMVMPDGTLEGRNTDVFGFTENLRASGYKPDGRPVTVIGAGGAARSAVPGLRQMGCANIRIVNRGAARAAKLARDFPGIEIFGWDDPAALKDSGLLVNATSLGMEGQPELELPLDTLPPDATVTDMVYAPLQTALLRRAAARGCRTIDGLGMLLHQARPAFAAFFGRDPEVTAALRRYVLGDI